MGASNSAIFCFEHKKAFRSNDLKASKLFGERAGTRTQDPYIKSVLLYQLSYAFNHEKATLFGDAKIGQIALITTFL